jgi:hypothetical protein
LPAGVSEALQARVQTLGPDALRLAQAMALCREPSFTLQECRLLSGARDMAELTRCLDELIVAEVISSDSERYAFQQRGWVPVIESTLNDETKRAVHSRLAEIYEKRVTDLGERIPFELYRSLSHALRDCGDSVTVFGM